MNSAVKILLVEDSEDDARLALRALRRGGFEPSHLRVQTAAELETALAGERWDAVISDYSMPGFTGMDALRMVRSAGLDIPFILVSGAIGEETAVDAMKAGANDYMMKQNLARLAPALQRELEDARTRATARQAQRDLAESEARFRSLTAMSSDFYWETDAEHRFTLRGAGSKPSTVPTIDASAQIGKRRWELPYISPDEAGWQAHRALLDAHQAFRGFELSRLGHDGTERFISISGDPVFDAAGAFTGYRGVGTDITERKAAAAKIERQTQLYAALCQCNEAIVRCTGEEALFAQICRTAVQFGGMKMAWIGMIAPDTRMVRLAASFGERAEAYLRGVEISVDAASPLGQGPTGIAVRGKQPVWMQDFKNYPPTAPWHRRRAPFGWGAAACLPLLRNGAPAGVLALYAGEAGAFDEAARHLLIEMAADISFALDNFAREAARAQAQTELREAEEQFRGLVEQSIAGIFIIQDDKLAYANPRFAEIFGYASVDELIGREAISLVVETERSAVLDQRRRVEGERQSISNGFTALCKDGAATEVGVHYARATHKGRPAVIGLMQDISEKNRAEEQIQRYVAQLQAAFMSTVEVATALSEIRDPYTAGHERRVGLLAAAIGAELGLDEQRVEGLRVAGYLHDIGKITIPAEILSKPGKLSAIEYQLIQAHPQSSYEVLKTVEFPWPIAEVALQHHERMDGSGYPQGLKAEAILFEARILAVADVIEAMSSHRPYRAGLGMDKALAEIERGRGSTYDAEVVNACLKLFREKAYAIPV